MQVLSILHRAGLGRQMMQEHKGRHDLIISSGEVTNFGLSDFSTGSPILAGGG